MKVSMLDSEKASKSSQRSSSPSKDSIEQTPSKYSHEDSERAPSPEILEAPITLEISRVATSIGTTETNDPGFEIDWDEDNGPDPLNPINWPTWYKGLSIFCVSWSTFAVIIYSTSYTTGLSGMQADFHISSEPLVTLGITSYLVGLAVGSLILAPLSEMYGRRPIYIISMFIFTILVIPCGLATSLAEVIIVRFFSAAAGSAMIANSPGTVSDIFTDKYRALGFSIWSIGPLNGPAFGPIIGDFSTQYLGWRFTNWIVMMLSGISFVLVCILKESYAPALLKKKARLRRKETGDERYWSRYDDKKTTLLALLRLNLSRPFIMIFTEPICIFWDIYVAIIYGILYLCYVAYPIVFTNIRHWSIGLTGLSFTGLAVGCFAIIVSEPLIRRMIESHKPDPETGKPPPEAMLSIICIGAVLAPIGELWFAWTCTPPVHWIWPVLASIPFGAGNTAVFIYASNYLAHSYGIYAASALAGNSVIRSLLGGTLPLVGPTMYSSLGPHWAGTLLGLLQVAIIPIPVVFWKYGGRIRRRSGFIRRMRVDRERAERKRRGVGGKVGNVDGEVGKEVEGV